MKSNTVRFSAIGVLIATTVLLIGFILGVVNSDELRDTFTKTVLIIGVLALSFIGIAALTGKK